MEQLTIYVDCLVRTRFDECIVIPFFPNLIVSSIRVNTLGATITTTCCIPVDVTIAPWSMSLHCSSTTRSSWRERPETRSVRSRVELLPERDRYLIDGCCNI